MSERAIEVTDELVAAYRKAYLAKARTFDVSGLIEIGNPELNDCIRAGLVAVLADQPLAEPAPVGSVPAGEAQEVAPKDAQEGDTVTRVQHGKVQYRYEHGGFVVEWSDGGREGVDDSATDVTVTRPVPPLPTEPGKVIRAQIEGVDGTWIAELAEGRSGRLMWNVFGYAPFSPEDFAAVVLSFVELGPVDAPAASVRPPAPLTGTNAGHGHVWERPDGVKARCGGPGACAPCSRDAARVAAGQEG